MNNYQPGQIKSQEKIKEEVAKSNWTLSYRVKGMTAGALAMFAYTGFYLNQSNPKMIIAGGVLGYFLGWLTGSFFYTKK